MALQPDNKIICTGTSTQPGGPVNLMLVRLKPDGNFDTSFGNDGISLSNAGVQSKDGGGVALQPSGKIVVAGNFSHETETSIGLMRFQSGLVVGTAEQASPKMALMAFPTLFSEALYLDFSALPAPVKSFAVFDGSGRLIYLDQHGAAGKLNIGEAGNWMPGIYVLQATTEHGVFVQKIMKH